MIKYAGMTKEQIIRKLRKTREELWKKELANSPKFERKVHRKMPDKQKAKEALKHFEKLREMIARRISPFHGMTEEEVIKKLRQTREELWEKKIGVSA